MISKVKKKKCNFSVPVQGGQAIPLYLEAILVMLSSLSTALQQEKEFINVIW